MSEDRDWVIEACRKWTDGALFGDAPCYVLIASDGQRISDAWMLSADADRGQVVRECLERLDKVAP